MTKASDNEFPSVLFGELGAAPTTPAAGKWRLYTKSDGLYVVDDAGASTGPFVSAAGGGIPATILDAKGDLIAASAADTAAKLTAGANGSFLQTLSTEAAGLIWRAAPAFASYKRTAGNYTTTSTTFADVDATAGTMTLTITTLARRVLIGFSGTIGNSGTNGNTLTVDLDGANLGAAVGGGFGGLVAARTPVANYPVNVSFTHLTDVLTAASHTFKLQWAVSAGTATMYGGGVNSAYAQFWVQETFFTT